MEEAGVNFSLEAGNLLSIESRGIIFDPDGVRGKVVA